MEYRRLGSAGVKLSTIGLGSYLTIGMSLSDEMSRATVRQAYDLGINFFDTANGYNRGQAEVVLGKCLSDLPRGSLVIATKVFSPMGEGPNDRGLSAKHIFEQCHESLRRLNVDYIDLYQCHRPDAAVPLEETVRTMEDLCRQGKVLYWGASEWPAWMLAQATGIARQLGARPPVSNQPRYSLLQRQAEAELFQYCSRAGVGNVTFSSLAHGLLTGKYLPGQPPQEGTRAADPRQNMVMKKVFWKEENLQKAAAFKQIAEQMGVRPSQLALAWVLRRGEVASAIMGASTVQQVVENAAAAAIKVPADVLTRLEELFPGPAESYPM